VIHNLVAKFNKETIQSEIESLPNLGGTKKKICHMKQACHMKQPPSMVVVVEGEEVMPRVQISTSEDKLMACMTLGSMDRSSRSF
jgi:hypothetical protein